MEQNEQITNNFIEWFRDYFVNETLLNLEIVDQNVPLPEGATRGFELFRTKRCI